MPYKMRFVQYFDKKDADEFLKLERKFIELEKRTSSMANGKRYVPVIGREPTNTLIWECEFASMESATTALKMLEESADHDMLLSEQIVFMRDTFVEIYREIE